MPLIFQREERVKIMRHSVSILKFRYLIGKPLPPKKKKGRKKSKNTTKKVQSSTSSRTKIIKWNNKENYLFGD